MDFSTTLMWRSVPILLEGLTVTLSLSFLAIFLSTVWGVFILLALRCNRLVYVIGRVYVEIMRNTPIIVIMFFIFFGSGMLGYPMTGFAAGLLSLVLQNGAYVAEIYRGGIQGVSTRQTEAGLALGFMPNRVFLLIILPQAVRKVIAPLGTQGVMIIKDTAIVATISVAEMTFQARLLADRTAAVFEIFIALAALYIILTSVFNLSVRLLERKYGYKN